MKVPINSSCQSQVYKQLVETCQTANHSLYFQSPFQYRKIKQGLADITLQKAAGHASAFPKVLKNFETERIWQISLQYSSLWQAIQRIYSWKSYDLGSKQAVNSTLQKSIYLTIQCLSQLVRELPSQATSLRNSCPNRAIRDHLITVTLVKFQHSPLLLNTAAERNSSAFPLVTFDCQVQQGGMSDS